MRLCLVFTTVTQLEGALEDGWQMFRGTFTPASSGQYRFEFRAIQGLSPAVSNLLDDIEFAPTECVSDPEGSDPNPEEPAPELAATGTEGVGFGAAALAALLVTCGAFMVRRRHANA